MGELRLKSIIIFLQQTIIAVVRFYLLLPIIVLMASPTSAQPLLKTNTDLSTAGYFQLNWDSPESGTNYQLQQASDPSFSSYKPIYEGDNTASVLSGLSDGFYHFRVLDEQGVASNIVTVRVQHHSLEKAIAFFSLGAVMFLILLTVLVASNRSETIR